MSMPSLCQEQVESLVEPFQGRIAGCLTRGVARWHEQQQSLGFAVSNRSKASLIFDYIADEAEREFAGDPRVRVKHRRGLPFLLIDGVLAVRFKKFRNSRLGVSVGRTRQQEQIASHQLQIAGTDVAPTWLTAGYRLDDTGLGVAQYAMTFSRDGHVEYVLDLDERLPVAPVVPLPVQDDDEDGLVIRAAGQQNETGASGVPGESARRAGDSGA